MNEDSDTVTITKVSPKKDNDEWATIKSGKDDSVGNTDTKGYEMHIKLGKGKAHNRELPNT